MANPKQTYRLNILKNKKLVSIYKNRKLVGLGKFSTFQILKTQGLTVFQKNVLNVDKPIKLINLGRQIIKCLTLKIKRRRLYRINILKSIRCFKGIRHSKSLPVRGQRTKTNAKTRKHRHVY